jgi:hypothetical protein
MLDTMLASLSLTSYASTFEEEELTLETLTWMAADGDSEFLSSMQELGMSHDDAETLLRALAKQSEGAAVPSSGPVPEQNGAAAPSAEPAPPVEDLPDEDLLGLVGRRGSCLGSAAHIIAVSRTERRA